MVASTALLTWRVGGAGQRRSAAADIPCSKPEHASGRPDRSPRFDLRLIHGG
jgi:hypothetical protein